MIFLIYILIILLIYYLINIGNTYISQDKKLQINSKRIIKISLILCFLYAFYRIMNSYSIIKDMVYTLIISIILAYLINPLVDYLEKGKMNRGLAVLFLYFLFVFGILILALIIIPNTGREIKNLLKLLPDYLYKLSHFFDTIYIKYYESMDSMPHFFQGIDEIIIGNIERLEYNINNKLYGFVEGIIFTFSKTISLILIPILTFYFIKDKDYFKERALGLLPEKYRQDTRDIVIKIDQALGNFIRGRLIMALYVGLATSLLLFIFRIDFALIIGLLTGVADIIPYLGPLLGFMPAVFFAFLHSRAKAIWVGLLFLGIQWVENNILAPRILGKSLGMHPISILLALVIGGGIFGVMGMILSIPILVIFKILYNHFQVRITSFYRRE